MQDSQLRQARRVNLQPLNMEAKRWLLQAKETPLETEPYSLQLAQWGIQNNLPVNEQGHPGISGSLQNLLLKLTKLTPQQQMNYLETGDPEPERDYQGVIIVASYLEEAESPEEAAELILETLISHVIANQE